MSAETKLVISTRLIFSETLDTDVSSTLLSNGQTAPNSSSIIDFEHLDEATAKAVNILSKLKDAITEPTKEGVPTDQHSEITALQHSILSEDDFDFSSLPSTSAGFDDNSDVNAASASNTLQSSFASEGYIETTNEQSFTETDSPINQDLISSDTQNKINTIALAEQSEAVDNAGKTLGSIHQSVTEDIRLEINGQIETALQLKSSNLETDYGRFEINSDGSWKYTLNNNSDSVQELSANSSAMDSVNILTQNGDSFTLNITIYGVNDTASISGDLTSEITASDTSNEQAETIKGKLSVSDDDRHEAKMHEEEIIEGSYGSMQINADGEWVYTLDSESDAIKSLHASDSLYDLLPVKSVDGTSQLIKITIHGTDDKPFLNGDNSETIDIASQLHAEQKLSIDDPDFGQSHFIAKDQIESRLDYGTGSNDEHGNWRFDLNTDNPQVLSLGHNQHLFDTFNVESVDGTIQEVIIVIKGSDHPIFETHFTNEEGLISYNKDSEDQQTLDNYLGTTEANQMAHASTSDTTSHSSGEILQQLQQQSSYEGNTFS